MFWNKIKFKIILFLSIFCCFVFVKLEIIYAQDLEGGGSSISSQAECEKALGGKGSGNMITVFDGTLCKQVDKSSWEGRRQSIENWLAEKEQNIEKWLKEEAAATAYKKALKYFLNTVAVDTATYLASGDEGQKPMFFTEDFGTYIKNVGDNAAGTFLEELGKESPIKFNLCQPNFAVNLKINLGLLQGQRPNKPQCTFSKMTQNWEKELKDPKFLNNFQDMFNPWSNDLGIALSLQSGVETKKTNEIEKAANQRIEDEGFKPVKGMIDEFIKTPGNLVRKQAEQPVAEETAWEKVHTGDMVADAIDIFMSTLAGKLLENWFKKGLATDMEDTSYNWDKLSFEGGGTTGGGAAGAKDRFKKIIQPEFGVRGDYDILGELTQCPDPNKAGPTNCVITDNFRQAIINKLTVGEAMKQGYLNPNGIFGFMSSNKEPTYEEMKGYPYRSMIILRKFRIIPVGWEVAAQYINQKSIAPKILKDLVDCYDGDDEYEGYEEDWCRGLVDPQWVLKAPLNYCKREGPGPEITSDQVVGSGDDSERHISRKDNYCGDEQSCIKEDDDGSCKRFGYCTEERRKWKFNGKTCDPTYNTCQTFRSTSGQTVSYLENTLDYGDCGVGNAGCKWYCEDYDYTDSKYTCTEAAGAKVYLDRGAEACDASAEGCHQFIRTRPGLGANLLINSSFEDSFADTIWEDANLDQSLEGYDGSKSLNVKSNLTDKEILVGPADYSIAGETYTLSFYAKNCGNAGKFGIDATTVNLETTADWQYYRISYIYPSIDVEGNKVKISITGADATCLVDAMKLERGAGTQYSDYGGEGTTYLKLAPEYLGCDGVGVDPAECDNFVRECTADEVGCEIYTPVNGGMTVAGKVTAQDYCPAECVGYNTFIQKESTFDSLRDSYFIAKTAKTCSASLAGCDEFTNLDDIKKGGEGKEYYTALKQCIKPDGSCAEFYTWEGSDETGYQLRVFQYQKDNDADDAGYPDLDARYVDDPAITEYDYKVCNEIIYNLPPSNPAYNADCRQFYNKAGGISYHLYSRTITCSNDCHPYRRTENNIDPERPDEASCGDKCSDNLANGDSSCWDDTRNVCYFCKNGGTWSVEQGACLYNAIPKQGKTCSAASAGCRGYVGNSGNNLMTVLSNDFEGGTKEGWDIITGQKVEPSNVVSSLGNKGSLLVDGTAAGINVSALVKQGENYVLQFSAKKAAAPDGDLTAKFTNGASSKDVNFAGAATINADDWGIYELNLINLAHEISADEKLIIEAPAGFYIDDIKLSQIKDKYYLIKNSWKTPASCDQDIFGNPWDLYMLGCNQYSDRAGETHYLHNFSQYCSDSAAGCELMIDTHNYSDYKGKDWNTGGDARDDKIIPADNFAYVVYDKEKECSKEDKGCQRLGDTYKYDGSLLFGDAFLRNNPDKYDEIMCKFEEDGCAEWKTSEGLNYFKNPGDQICERRTAAGLASSTAWYKKKVKRCDTDNNGGGDGAVCLKDGDCADNKLCKLESADRVCDISNLMTFGYGGIGNEISQPSGDWAGVCPAAQSGCTEYIDPLSKFSPNLTFNGDFEQDVDRDTFADGWKNVNGLGAQEINLNSNSLYILSVSNANTVTLSTPGLSLSEITNANLIGSAKNSIAINTGAGDRESILFYLRGGVSPEITATIEANNFAANNNSTIELKKAVIDYQLRQELDKNSCNGIVNFEDGCVLFNQRNQNGSSLSSLPYDADLTYSDGNGVAPQAGANAASRDSNIILKVSPDRVCDKWLACKSYATTKDAKGVESSSCYNIGLCNSLSESGDCDNFILEDKTERQTNIPAPNFSAYGNVTGYSKVGYNDALISNDMKGLYPFGKITQEGEIGNVSNGNFEETDTTGYPIGWEYDTDSWNKSVFEVIDNPVAAQAEGISYSPEGNNFLKLGSTFKAISEYVDVIPKTTYVLTAYINTKNLNAGTAYLQVDGFTSQGGSPIQTIANLLEYGKGGDWALKLKSFETENNVSRLKITLYASGATIGNFYFDDIKLKPAANTRTNWYAPQSCRLYPEDTSLSCQYFDDSGVMRKGWPGYCLEYDRAPGSANACLLWWPVDRVKGDGIEEGVGYSGRLPVYFTTEVQNKIVTYDPSFKSEISSSGSKTITAKELGIDDSGCQTVDGIYICFTRDDIQEIRNDARVYWTPDHAGWVQIRQSLTEANGWTDTRPMNDPSQARHNCRMTANFEGDKFSSLSISKLADCGYWRHQCAFWPVFKVRARYASKISQVVTPAGKNKYWSGRVYSGSDFSIKCNVGLPNFTQDCVYTTDYNPFGSVYNLTPDNNPELWDSNPDSKDTIDPLNILPEAAGTTNARAGQVYTPKNASRLFAQSYNTWIWQGNQCIGGSKAGGYCGDKNDDSECVGTCNTYCRGTAPISGVTVYGPQCDQASDCVLSADKKTTQVDPASLEQATCNAFTGKCEGGCRDGFVCGAGALADNEKCRSGICSDEVCDPAVPGQCKCVGGINNGASCRTNVLAGDVDNPTYTKAESSLCQIANCFNCLPAYQKCKDSDADTCAIDSDCNGTCQRINATSKVKARYVKSKLNNEWGPPTDRCPGNVRPAYDSAAADPNDLCYVLPLISNIKADDKNNDFEFPKSKFVKLSFNSDVDSQQMPMVMYGVDWGDYEKTIVTGAEMRDKPNEEDPQVLYHLYSYWDLKSKQLVDQTAPGINGQNMVYCGKAGSNAPVDNKGAAIALSITPDQDYCAVQPKVQIKDNWGWCNKGININICDLSQWDNFGGWIVVEEK